MEDLTKYEAEAYALGTEHARNAASWVVDGNTKRELIPAVIEMFDAGDPAVYDYLPAMPDLSGEYADDPTPATLAGDILGADPTDLDVDPHVLDALCEAYERGVSDTFAQECERILRSAIAS